MATIDGIVGTVATGQELVINGSGFGTKTQAAPVLYDKVGGMPEYSALVDNDPIPLGPTEIWDGGFVGVYSTSRPQRNAELTAHYWNTGPKANVGGLTRFRNLTSRTIYMSWWAKTDVNPDISGSNKRLRLTDDPVNYLSGSVIGPTQFNIEWIISTGGFASAFSASRNWGHEPAAEFDTWLRHEVIWEPDNGGLLQFTTDAQIVQGTDAANDYDANTAVGSNIAPGAIDVGLVGAFDHSLDDPAYAAANHDYGEIYVDTTQQRVEIGNAATWAACSHREIQPATLWGDLQVRVTLSQGSLSTLTGSWLYVIDVNGVVSNAEAGFPLGALADPILGFNAAGAQPIRADGTVPQQNADQNAAVTPLDMNPFFTDAASTPRATRNPSTWADVGTSLPAGVTIDVNTGIISGTPTVFGTFPVTIQVTDDGANTATQSFSYVVAESAGADFVMGIGAPGGSAWGYGSAGYTTPAGTHTPNTVSGLPIYAHFGDLFAPWRLEFGAAGGEQIPGVTTIIVTFTDPTAPLQPLTCTWNGTYYEDTVTSGNGDLWNWMSPRDGTDVDLTIEPQ